ncbi:hypothetical protein L208DRAFT_1376555 [Tricholoma matsutake]|nr:hypothetical protein L208DRAFT_1376555 [Tricholoma matsutake 945]
MGSNSMFRFALLVIVSTFIISANAAPVPGQFNGRDFVSDIVAREDKKSLLTKRGNNVVTGKKHEDHWQELPDIDDELEREPLIPKAKPEGSNPEGQDKPEGSNPKGQDKPEGQKKPKVQKQSANSGKKVRNSKRPGMPIRSSRQKLIVQKQL